MASNKICLHIEGTSLSAASVWHQNYYYQTRQSLYTRTGAVLLRPSVTAVSSAIIRGVPGSNSIIGREEIVARNYQADALNILFLDGGANDFATAVGATNGKAAVGIEACAICVHCLPVGYWAAALRKEKTMSAASGRYVTCVGSPARKCACFKINVGRALSLHQVFA